MLGSLPESYDNFILSLNTEKIEDLKWENIKALLIEEHLKRTERGTKSKILVKRKHCLARKEICLAKEEIRRTILERNLKIDL